MAVIQLPERFDLSQVGGVAETLRTHRGDDLRLDAASVTHLGALGLQLILSARESWAVSGKAFSVSPRSAEFDEALTQFGIEGIDVPGDREDSA